MRCYNFLVVPLCFLFFYGCEKTIVQPHEINSAKRLSKLSTDIPITSVATSSALWPASNAIDGDTTTIWSSNVDPSANTTEWIAYWFCSASDGNGIS